MSATTLVMTGLWLGLGFALAQGCGRAMAGAGWWLWRRVGGSPTGG